MSGPQSAESIRRAFDEREALTIGAEEELMLLDPKSGDLAEVATRVLERTEGDPRFKLEMPAAQLEIVTDPAPTVSDLVAQLRASRRDLAERADGVAGLAAAGVHPFAATKGTLNPGPRYEATLAEYGGTARRQLVYALQIHVAPGSADRALAVYNALRSYLPDIAALAANAPILAGSESGMASVRPQIAGLLPRQGVPPAFATFDEFAEALRWGTRLGTMPDASAWWWELRPHPGFGTLEVRVPDTQTTVGEAGAVAAFVHSLAGWLGERHDAGERLPVHRSWRIAENRWRAMRAGVEATLGDLDAGTPIPARERLSKLLDSLEPTAQRLNCAAELRLAREQVAANGAIRQVEAWRARGAHGLVDWLRSRFLD
jgi:carboxylate-amine ligase